MVLIPFPFTNLTATKLRSALVLFEGERDVVVAFVSSRVPREPGPTDIMVDEACGLRMLWELRIFLGFRRRRGFG